MLIYTRQIESASERNLFPCQSTAAGILIKWHYLNVKKWLDLEKKVLIRSLYVELGGWWTGLHENQIHCTKKLIYLCLCKKCTDSD